MKKKTVAPHAVSIDATATAGSYPPPSSPTPTCTPPTVVVRTIKEWCGHYKVSRSSFYNLDKEGLAPSTIRIGRKRLITPEADQAWNLRMAEVSR